MNLKDIIIHEDSDIIIINKPVGLVVHGDGKAEFETLSDLILKERPEIKDIGESVVLQDGSIILRPGIVHRLDKNTSGVMVIVKNFNAYMSLKQQFHDHTVKKHYVAIVFGSFNVVRGEVAAPIGRSNLDIRKWAAGVHARGEKKDAITKFTIKKTIKVRAGDEKDYALSLIDLYPQTGRTHQLRVHMQFVQHPIIGDDLYASYLPKFFDMNRQALHAADISFTHPTTKKLVKYEAPMPSDMALACANFL
jgi:23S rRNA pseudouridine1911/1915/1917 synthase